MDLTLFIWAVGLVMLAAIIIERRAEARQLTEPDVVVAIGVVDALVDPDRTLARQAWPWGIDA